MLRHTSACQNKWSMEIQLCTCGAQRANRELQAKDREIDRLKMELAAAAKLSEQGTG